MNKKYQQEQGSAIAVFAVCVTAALIFALGWIFWQNFIYKSPIANQSKAHIPQKNTTEESKLSQSKDSNYLVVENWGVKFKLPSDIQSVTYHHADNYIPSDSITIDSIVTTDNKSYVKFTPDSTGDPSNFDGICYIFGVGRSTRGNESYNDAALTYTQKLGNYYYYPLTLGGAACAESESATKLTSLVEGALKSPEKK